MLSKGINNHYNNNKVNNRIQKIIVASSVKGVCKTALPSIAALHARVFSISRGAPDHDNEKDEDLGSKRSDEEIVTQSSPKRQKVRKGVAQRAPMY
ncbi:unnamed protein product [Camellia sinensis]